MVAMPSLAALAAMWLMPYMHEVEVGRLQEHHVNADMVVVGGLHGDVRGGAAGTVELRIARPHDQQVDVGVFPVVAPGAGTKEQPAFHAGHAGHGRRLTPEDRGACRAAGPRSFPDGGMQTECLGCADQPPRR